MFVAGHPGVAVALVGLTASTQEHCLFCNYGLGANGKTTLAETYRYIAGDYAGNLPFSALEMKNRNSNDLVALAGARFVTASETNEGVRLNEARIKSLTGGDPITARKLYREFFTFPPTHKLWLSFNHKPIIADDSEGMWRRVRLIPFTCQFKPEEQDKHLLNKLKAEAPGILTWMVLGCAFWQQEGLGMPPAVAEATAAYREESDHVGEFIEDACVVGPSEAITSGALLQAYTEWADRNEEIRLPRNSLGERLEKRGFHPTKIGHNRTRGWTWIGLREGGYADTRTDLDPLSDKSPIGENVIESLAKSAPAPVRTSAPSQNPAKNGATGAVRKEGDTEGGAEKRVLEVEI